LTTADTIRELLSTFADARCPLSKSGSHGNGNGTPSMTSQWHSGSYQQLEDALKDMRARGKQEFSQGMPLSTLWWYLSQEYLMSERKVVWKVGDRKVEKMVTRPKCICGIPFTDTAQARRHIEKIHRPIASLTIRYPAKYQNINADRRMMCEGLAISWLVGWFRQHGIKPRLPREKAA
jgi:hypothetical protein